MAVMQFPIIDNDEVKWITYNPKNNQVNAVVRPNTWAKDVPYDRNESAFIIHLVINAIGESYTGLKFYANGAVALIEGEDFSTRITKSIGWDSWKRIDFGERVLDDGTKVKVVNLNYAGLLCQECKKPVSVIQCYDFAVNATHFTNICLKCQNK